MDDCEVISRKLGDWLDKEDFISESYILEVSSPGLGRPLKKEKDFVRSLGKDVEVRLYRMRDKQKEFTGALSAYDAQTVTLDMDCLLYTSLSTTVKSWRHWPTGRPTSITRR